MIQEFNSNYRQIIKGYNKPIFDFGVPKSNVDDNVVESFGEEWSKFLNFSHQEIDSLGDAYFSSILHLLDKDTTVLDVGCGTGRWTKYLSSKVGFIDAIDPSKAIFSADTLLKDTENVRLSIASTDNIPFFDETFDFVMSIGVLHHIPDTQKAMNDCVKKVKKGGYFYTYLYYSFDNRGMFFKLLFNISDIIRKVVSKLPSNVKKSICDFLAFSIYLPLIYLNRIIRFLGFNQIASRLPLAAYHDKSLYIIRNDALDRFGTELEQRFSKSEINEMMVKAGLKNIFFPENAGFWVAVGQK